MGLRHPLVQQQEPPVGVLKSANPLVNAEGRAPAQLWRARAPAHYALTPHRSSPTPPPAPDRTLKGLEQLLALSLFLGCAAVPAAVTLHIVPVCLGTSAIFCPILRDHRP